MSFQFVNTNPNSRTPDDKTRKKIRSQVMKDYRRKQDGSMDATTTDLMARSGSPSTRVSMKRITRPPSDSPPTSPPGEVLGSRSSKRGRPSKSQQERAASLFLQTAHGLFSNFTVNVNSQDTVMDEDSDEIDVNDSGELSRMDFLCKTFKAWIEAEGTLMCTIMRQPQSPFSNTSMQMLYSQSLMAIGHLSAVNRYEDDDEERAYLKARLLRLATISLQDPARARANTTLEALGCLASYEISFDSHEALTHLNGISRIIEWRGGIDEIGHNTALTVFLEIIDMLHAIYFHVDPVYAVLQRSSPTSDDDAESSTDIARGWQDQMREAASFLTEQDNLKASRACFLAWRVLLFQPQGTAVWTEQSIKEMDELFRVMVAASDDIWTAYPALQTRVLMTALATAVEKTQKAWYYTTLSRLVFHTKPRHWTELKSLIISFLDSQAFYRSPIVHIVRAMVSGVTIVIERSLAAHLGLQPITS